MTMTMTGQYLMDRLEAALRAHQAGGTATAVGPHGEWSIASQTFNARPTGKLVLVCDNAGALAEFKELAKDAKHIVMDVTAAENTVIIIPARPRR